MMAELFIPFINHSLKKVYRAIWEGKAVQDTHNKRHNSDMAQNHKTPSYVENTVEEARTEG